MDTLTQVKILLAIYAITYLLRIPGMWKLFEKADQAGWKSLIPLYNVYITLKIIGKPWWLLILYVIPFSTILANAIICHHLSLSFGKGVAYTIGLFFWGTSFIFYSLLGFSDSEYHGTSGVV